MSPNVVVAAGGHAMRQFRLVKVTRPPWPGFLFLSAAHPGASHRPLRYRNHRPLLEGPQVQSTGLHTVERASKQRMRPERS